MIVRTALATAFALGAMTSVALAEEPIALTDAQLDGVTAGQDLFIDFADEFLVQFAPPEIDVEQDNDADVFQLAIANRGSGGVSQSADVTQVNVSVIEDVTDLVGAVDAD